MGSGEEPSYLISLGRAWVRQVEHVSIALSTILKLSIPCSERRKVRKKMDPWGFTNMIF